MDFRELVYVITVADCRSVTAAAKKLYISQPSLSQIISKVEQDVGVKLFDRTAYPITLTYAGEKYVDTARKITKLNENLRKELRDIGDGCKGRIILGIPSERAGYMLSPVLPQFRARFPEIEVRTIEAKSDALLEALLKGEMDFIVLPRRQQDLPGETKAELIYKEKLILVAGDGMITEDMLLPGYPNSVNLQALNMIPIIQLKKGHAIRQKVDRILKEHKVSPPTIMETSSCISAVQLAAAGYGFSIVPKRAIDVLGGECQFHCYNYTSEEKTWDVNVIYKEDAYRDKAELYFVQLMKDIFGDSSGGAE